MNIKALTYKEFFTRPDTGFFVSVDLGFEFDLNRLVKGCKSATKNK